MNKAAQTARRYHLAQVKVGLGPDKVIHTHRYRRLWGGLSVRTSNYCQRHGKDADRM
jgi:hypothetical protein